MSCKGSSWSIGYDAWHLGKIFHEFVTGTVPSQMNWTTEMSGEMPKLLRKILTTFTVWTWISSQTWAVIRVDSIATSSSILTGIAVTFINIYKRNQILATFQFKVCKYNHIVKTFFPDTILTSNKGSLDNGFGKYMDPVVTLYSGDHAGQLVYQMSNIYKHSHKTALSLQYNSIAWTL